MLNKKPRILFTTHLSEQKRTQLENGTLLIESEPFITFEYKLPGMWTDQLPQKTDAWIFTSKKAVKALSPVADGLELPNHVFAVGSKTAEKLEEIGIEVSIPEEYNARALAAMIQEFELNKIVHFCGNLKALDLNKLLGNHTELVSIEVYQTKLTKHKMNDLGSFNAVVFMSPSSIESFSYQNSIPQDMTVFCIGPTTGEAAKDAGITSFITPEYSTIDSLMESIHHFYS